MAVGLIASPVGAIARLDHDLTIQIAARSLYVPGVPRSVSASRPFPFSRSAVDGPPDRTHRFRTRTALVLGALLLPALLPTASAHAESPDGDRKSEKEARPPEKMSTVGGDRLGKPGTQVAPKAGAGAPTLPKKVSARSWIVSDAESGEVLAAHNPHWKLPPASTLKMLFADAVLPKLPKEKEHRVRPSDLEGVGEGSSLVGVKEDETYSVHDLWLGVFLRSGNDAVHVLSAMNGGKAKTLREMNARAKELRALDTHAVSPDGYDHPGQVSSAYDLSLIARSGMQNKDFREYAATPNAKFPAEKKKGKKRGSFEIQNTNRLLTGEYNLDPYPGMAGVKNGTTSEAGSTFTGVAERGDRVLLVTVMHPEKDGVLPVFRETARLLDWGFEAADKVKPVGTLVAPASDDEGQAGGSGDDAPAKAQGGPDSQASDGMGTALAVTGGVLVVLGAVGFLVRRRWPLPERDRPARRRTRTGRNGF